MTQLIRGYMQQTGQSHGLLYTWCHFQSSCIGQCIVQKWRQKVA